MVTLRTLAGDGWFVNSAAWSPDGRFLASGLGYCVCIWNIETGMLLQEILAEYVYSVTSVAWSPDGRFLASGSSGGAIRMWDVATGTPVWTFNASVWVRSVAWSPDGRTLAAGLADRTVRLWDAATRSQLRTLEAHTGVSSLAWSPDGRLIASGSGGFLSDDVIRVWDAGTGTLVWTLRGDTRAVQSLRPPTSAQAQTSLGRNTRAVESVTWSPDGDFLASGSDDDIIRIWDMRTKPLTETCLTNGGG
jgi:WD40 repeat protein